MILYLRAMISRVVHIMFGFIHSVKVSDIIHEEAQIRRVPRCSRRSLLSCLGYAYPNLSRRLGAQSNKPITRRPLQLRLVPIPRCEMMSFVRNILLNMFVEQRVVDCAIMSCRISWSMTLKRGYVPYLTAFHHLQAPELHDHASFLEAKMDAAIKF